MPTDWDSIPSVPKAPSWDDVPTTPPSISTPSPQVTAPIHNPFIKDKNGYTVLDPKQNTKDADINSIVHYKGEALPDVHPFPDNDNFGFLGNKAVNFGIKALNDPMTVATGLFGKFGRPSTELPKVELGTSEAPKDIPLATESKIEESKPNPLKPKVKLNKDTTYTAPDGKVYDSYGKDVSAYPEGLRTSKGKTKITLGNADAGFDSIPDAKPEVNVNSGNMPNVAGPSSEGGGELPPVSDPSNPGDFNWKDYWNNHSIKDIGIDVLNAPKSMQTAPDLSAPLRQGRALAHKKEFWTSLDDMFKSAGSEEGYQAVRKGIAETPRYTEALDNGLSLTDLEGDISKREEQFASRIAEHIPGYGKYIRASGRAYTGFLDKMRMDLYQNLADGWEKAGVKYDPKELADFINTASGRGRLAGKHMEQAAPFLNQAIYSPRLIASRVRFIGQGLNPVTYVKAASPGVRREYLKSMFALMGTTALTGKLASMIPGVTVSADPTSSDFGKIKIGNTRHDLMGGFQQYSVLLSRLATKSINSSTGKKIPIDSGKFGMPTTFNVLADFARNKSAPVPGAVINSLAGKDPVGNDTNAGKELAKLYIPMLAQDIYDIYKDDPTAVAEAIPGIFGDSIQTYSNKSTGKGKFSIKMPKVKF